DAREACEPILVARTMLFRHDQVAQGLSDRVVARPSEDRLRLRVPIDDDSVLVHLNERGQGRVDDAARHSLAVKESLLYCFALRDIAHDLGSADDDARRRFDRRHAERDVNTPLVFAGALGFVMVDYFSAAYLFQDTAYLGLAVVWNDDADVAADRLLGDESKEALSSRIPPGNDAVERLGHD